MALAQSRAQIVYIQTVSTLRSNFASSQAYTITNKLTGYA